MLRSYNSMFTEMVGSCDWLFEVNNYQRFYVWSSEKVQTYIDDIVATIARLSRDESAVHFFGQMIFLQKGTDDRNRSTYEVIDGQQRLTTFLMFMAAIKGMALQLRTVSLEIEREAREVEEYCEKYLKSTKQGAPTTSKLVLAPQDNTYFQQILQNLSIGTVVEVGGLPVSHKFLYEAQKTILQKLYGLIGTVQTPADKMAKLQELATVAAEKFQVVSIIPTAEEYTYQLYQVVNDRGEPLKDSELLKAKSIEVLAGNAARTEAAKLIWNDILSDPGSDTEKYLTWCYMSKVGEDKKELRYYHAYLKHYFRIQDNSLLSDEAQESFLTDLQELHKDIVLCRKLAKGIWPFDDGACQQWQKNVLANLIVGMKHTLCIPVLISAYRQPRHHGVSTEENFYKCLELCETFFVLIKGVFRWREDRFKAKYLSAAVSMRATPIDYRWALFRNDLKQIDSEVLKRDCLSRLKEAITYAPKATNSVVKYLLILLETYYPTFDAQNKPHPDRVPDGTGLVFSEISVEHIYAEAALPQFLDPNLEPEKHKLGNLLPYGKRANSILKSKPYEQKIPYYRGVRLATASALVDTCASWSQAEFEVRHQDVCVKLNNLLLRFHD